MAIQRNKARSRFFRSKAIPGAKSDCYSYWGSTKEGVNPDALAYAGLLLMRED
jgi:hypothetical protein